MFTSFRVDIPLSHAWEVGILVTRTFLPTIASCFNTGLPSKLEEMIELASASGEDSFSYRVRQPVATDRLRQLVATD